jgi:hypothetical protein
MDRSRGVSVVALLALGVLVGLGAPATAAAAAPHQAQLRITGGAAGDNYGTAVAISADTVVIGAPEADPAGKTAAGAAYIFVRSSGVWKLQKKLVAGDGAAGDRFGSAVAISGNTVVIGARYCTVGGVLQAGAAYVYVRSSGVWKLQKKLTAVDRAFSDHFGWSVAISGNTVVAGAVDRDTGAKADTGGAYVFLRSGTVWAKQQTLSVPEINALAQDHFGEAVAVYGNTALIGVPDGDWLGSPDAGMAYAYSRSGAVWTVAPVLYAAGTGATADRFGGSVSLSGNTAVVGASGHDVTIHANAGVVYHFARVAGVWGAPDYWYAVDNAAGDFLGGAVSVSGHTVVAGATNHASATVPDAGAVYTFSTVIALATPPLYAAVPAPGDDFGDAVGVSGDTFVAGAPLRDTGGLADSGAAFVFQPDPHIYSLLPTAARRGTTVTISGTGFGRTRGASFVKFGTVKCTSYSYWSSGRITCRVPATAVIGKRTVRVTLKVGTSNSMSFTVKR